MSIKTKEQKLIDQEVNSAIHYMNRNYLVAGIFSTTLTVLLGYLIYIVSDLYTQNPKNTIFSTTGLFLAFIVSGFAVSKIWEITRHKVREISDKNFEKSLDRIHNLSTTNKNEV